jgi:putative intracellular protease/amidase
MLRGLEGRRIALFVSPDDESAASRLAVLTRVLEQAGARIHVLSAANTSEEDFHGARYAALVLLGDDSGGSERDPRLVQLAREFLASDKPIAAFGGALEVLLDAGGAAGRTLAAHGALERGLRGAGAELVDEAIHVDGSLITAQGNAKLEEFATRIAAEFSEQLEENALDEMVDLSFPASDPPATTPAAIGRVAPDSDTDARP